MVNELLPLSPVFLHSGFRSGSTWFWKRFRVAENSYAYYEPFNEVLGGLTLDDIPNYKTTGWASGHPDLIAPYYEEFRPLIRPEGGVIGFRDEFAYGLYYNKAPHAPQREYIETLARHARDLGRVPVFGFCRSFGRVPWLRQHIAGRHIVTLRNPKDQWISYCNQLIKYDNSYFQCRAYLIGYIGWKTGVYSNFYQDLPFPDLLNVPELERGKKFFSHFESLDMGQRCRIFLRSFALDMLIALPQADLVVDLDQLSADPVYRRDMTEQLRTLTGLMDLSFDDCALPRSEVEDPVWTMAVEQERAFLDHFFSTLSLPAEASRVINLVKDMVMRKEESATFAVSRRA